MRIAITAGEPAGIGPDIIIALAQEGLPDGCIVIANRELMLARAKQLQLPLSITEYNPNVDVRFDQSTQNAIQSLPQNNTSLNNKSTITLLNTELSSEIICGKPSVHSAQYVLETLRRAGVGALSGEFDAIVTAPVHKGIICDAGFDFSGHTEFFAALCNIEKPVMMLANAKMRVALVTTHVSILNLPSLINTTNIHHTCEIVHRDLITHFGISSPRIALLGLNPHAGENGHLGREEIDIISPCIFQLQKSGMNIIGPIPADTAFTQSHLEQYDAYIAMYHDQALPVVKYSDFDHTVNITLGLPLIRTSVDHGTACELAGTGRASHTNLGCAIQAAISMVKHS